MCLSEIQRRKEETRRQEKNEGLERDRAIRNNCEATVGIIMER